MPSVCNEAVAVPISRGEEGAKPKDRPLDSLVGSPFTDGHELMVVAERTRYWILSELSGWVHR